MRMVGRREGSGGGVRERDSGEDAGGGESVWRSGGGPLGGVKMRDRDSGGDVLDEGGDIGEMVRAVLARALARALATDVGIGVTKLVVELRVPSFRGGRGGETVSTIGVEVRGAS